VLSESWKNFYTNNLGLKTEQVVVLPNPVKLPSQVPHRIHRDKVSFVFLGRIGQRKGTFDLIRAFSLLPAEQKTKSELVVAGDGDVEQARRLVESLNLVEYITVLDWIDSAQRDALLAKADVFVLPSYNEGLPMALIEAMSWGLPVVTTPVGGIPELVTHTTNGLLVNPGNIQQLSEAMQSLLKDENMRLSLGRTARLSVIHLDVEKYLNSLLCIYCAMLDSRKQGYVKTLPN
jgi:glycosyltransferase involved in cell wall biosynthesis